MSDDDRVCLTMSDECLRDLRLRASVASRGRNAPGSQALLDAIAVCEWLGFNWNRVRCNEQALRFIREEAPDIARRWPAAFGEVEQPRSLVLAKIGVEAAGKTIAGLEVDRQGCARIVLDGGAAIVLEPDGTIDYHEGIPR